MVGGWPEAWECDGGEREASRGGVADMRSEFSSEETACFSRSISSSSSSSSEAEAWDAM